MDDDDCLEETGVDVITFFLANLVAGIRGSGESDVLGAGLISVENVLRPDDATPVRTKGFRRRREAPSPIDSRFRFPDE